jgi:hypothetical protein
MMSATYYSFRVMTKCLIPIYLLLVCASGIMASEAPVHSNNLVANEVPASAALIGTAQTGTITYVEVRFPWLMWCEIVEDQTEKQNCGAPYYHWHLYRANIEHGFIVDHLTQWGPTNRRWPRNIGGIPIIGPLAVHLTRNGVVTSIRPSPSDATSTTNIYPSNGKLMTDSPIMTDTQYEHMLHSLQSFLPTAAIDHTLDSGPSNAVVSLIDRPTYARQIYHVNMTSTGCSVRCFDTQIVPLRLPCKDDPFLPFRFYAADADSNILVLIQGPKIYRLFIRDKPSP